MDVMYLLSQLIPEPSIDENAPLLCGTVRPCASNTASGETTANVVLLPDDLVTKTPTVSQKSGNCYLFLKLGDYVC